VKASANESDAEFLRQEKVLSKWRETSAQAVKRARLQSPFFLLVVANKQADKFVEDAESEKLVKQRNTKGILERWQVPSVRKAMIVAWTVMVLTLIATQWQVQSENQIVCVTSNSDEIVRWALGTSANITSKIQLRRLTTVLSEGTELKKSDYDALNQEMTSFLWPWRDLPCDRVIVIVRASQLVDGRNPLHRYSNRTGSLLFLQHSESTLVIVNGTCDNMVRGIADHKTGRVEECKHSRGGTFLEFQHSKVSSNLVPSTTHIKDVPPMTSAEQYFNLLFTNELYQDPNDAHSGRFKLQSIASQSPYQFCQFGHKIIKDSFSGFQISLIGKEGAGKSTTARWLAHHLNTAESLTNSFSSARSGASFTRNFNQVELTPTLVLTDTMGFTELSPKFLCDIKRLLDGNLVSKAGEAMKWSETEMCKPETKFWLPLRWYYGWQDWCYYGKCNPINLQLQVHALLLVIPYTADSSNWAADVETINTFVSAMKSFVSTESTFDLMDRIVFAITNAPHDIVAFQSLVDKMSLPALDTFPITSSINTTLGNTKSEVIFITPETYHPILMRLQQKACKFFKDEVVSRSAQSGGSLSWRILQAVWSLWASLCLLILGISIWNFYCVQRTKASTVPQQSQKAD